jgi:hypothetical protein
MAVCDVLMEHGAVDFSYTNAQKALSCLAPGTEFQRGVAMTRGEFHFRYLGKRVVMVTLRFDDDQEVGGEVLELSIVGQ